MPARRKCCCFYRAPQVSNPAALWIWPLRCRWGSVEESVTAVFFQVALQCWWQFCMLFYLELSAFVGTRCLGYGVQKSSNRHRGLICLALFSVSVSYKPREFDKFNHVRFPAKKRDVSRSATLFVWVFFWHMKVCFSGHQWAPKSSAHTWKLSAVSKTSQTNFQHLLTLCLCSTEGPTGQCGLSVTCGGKWVPLLKKYPWKWHFQRESQHSLTQRSNCKMHRNHILAHLVSC